MKLNPIRPLHAALAGLVMLGTATTQATMILTVSAPGVQNTSVAAAGIETFDAIPQGIIGSHFSASIGGTYSSGRVYPSNEAGGAGGGGLYSLVGGELTTFQSIDFAAPKTYFGLWWSAIDVTNQIEFFNEANVSIGSFGLADLLPQLTPGHLGNPNNGANSGEYFAYVNFTAIGGDLINRVLITNPLRGGFESDNHAAALLPPVPPGGGVPEPTSALFGLGLIGVASLRRQR